MSVSFHTPNARSPTKVHPSDRIYATRSEAKRILSVQSESDKSEQEYILDYYSLVREGKTNFVATTAFQFVTDVQATEPDDFDFFKLYAAELRPRKKVKA